MNEPHGNCSTFELALIRETEGGLPLVARPYNEIATRLGVKETQVVEGLARLIRRGCIKRMGVIVRHHELGYRANAMVVWDVPENQVDGVGRCFGDTDFVNLCYRRPRRLPHWPYNLFTMIHGRDRGHVLKLVSRLIEVAPVTHLPHEILFSGRRFKQRGARYMGNTPCINSDEAHREGLHVVPD